MKPGRKAKPPADRFFTKVAAGQGGCIIWTGGRFGNGYGMFYPGPSSSVQKTLAHRWSYEHFTGQEIPADSALDHLCKNILCVNPHHLEPVSQKVNIHRGNSFAAKNAQRSRCINDHELTGDNLILRPNGRGRDCRECRRARDRKRRPRKAA